MSVARALAQLVAGGVLLVFALAMCADKKNPPTSEPQVDQARAAAAAERERRAAEHREKVEAIRVTKIRWRLDGFGSVLILAPTLQNTGQSEVRDIKLTCTLLARSGTTVGTVSHVVYDLLPAGKARSFPEVNLGFVNEQSAKLGCEVADANTF
jgi:hypothetical protein